MSKVKLSDEEIKSLLNVKENGKLIIQEFGQITLAEENLKQRKSAAVEFLNNLKQKETELAKQLEDKYGKGTVNTDTGEFIPA